MSYDIYLLEPKTKDGIDLKTPHHLRGGTYAVGGTREAWLNITYNYSKHYYRLFGEKGLRIIYGITGEQSIPILQDAVNKLNDNVSEDYWEPTEGNARVALINLIELAKMAPYGIWDGD